MRYLTIGKIVSVICLVGISRTEVYNCAVIAAQLYILFLFLSISIIGRDYVPLALLGTGFFSFVIHALLYEQCLCRPRNWVTIFLNY